MAWPSNLLWLLYRCIHPRLYDESREKIAPAFFQRPENQGLQASLQRRLCSSLHLKNNNLSDDEEAEWQQMHLQSRPERASDLPRIHAYAMRITRRVWM